MKNQTVYVLSYSHRHGLDINVYSTQKSAEKSKREIEASSEFRDDEECVTIDACEVFE
jgi:hypothetical protein